MGFEASVCLEDWTGNEVSARRMQPSEEITPGEHPYPTPDPPARSGGRLVLIDFLCGDERVQVSHELAIGRALQPQEWRRI